MTASDHIAALETALGRGVLRADYPDGSSVVYASEKDLRGRLEYFRAQSASSASKPVVRRVLVGTSPGF